MVNQIVYCSAVTGDIPSASPAACCIVNLNTVASCMVTAWIVKIRVRRQLYHETWFSLNRPPRTLASYTVMPYSVFVPARSDSIRRLSLRMLKKPSDASLAARTEAAVCWTISVSFVRLNLCDHTYSKIGAEG
jgi:hypothetical protein